MYLVKNIGYLMITFNKKKFRIRISKNLEFDNFGKRIKEKLELEKFF